MGFGIFAIIVGLFSFFTGVAFDEVNIFLVIMGVIFTGIGVIIVYFSSQFRASEQEINDPDRKEKAFEKWISENLSQYNISKDDMKYLNTADKYYFFKPDMKKFIFINYKGEY
ncbi:hypothetical protein, partial [Heyndrickxia sporothermodurans]